MIVAAIIMVGVLLFVLGANQSNEVVSAITDAGRWLVGPFDNLFSISDPKWERAINWGIAAAVYALIGSLIARLLASVGMASREHREHRARRGWGFRRRRPVV